MPDNKNQMKVSFTLSGNQDDIEPKFKNGQVE